MNKNEKRCKKCKELGIKYYSSKNKSQLIEMIITHCLVCLSSRKGEK